MKLYRVNVVQYIKWKRNNEVKWKFLELRDENTANMKLNDIEIDTFNYNDKE